MLVISTQYVENLLTDLLVAQHGECNAKLHETIMIGVTQRLDNIGEMIDYVSRKVDPDAEGYPMIDAFVGAVTSTICVSCRSAVEYSPIDQTVIIAMQPSTKTHIKALAARIRSDIQDPQEMEFLISLLRDKSH